MMRVKFKSDLRRLDKIERDIEGNTLDALQEAAEALVTDIRANWSDTSPSTPGNPPAIKTGNLDGSVKANRQGRGEGGRFASSKNVKYWYVTIDTSEGPDPRNRGQYAGILEDSRDRPFVAPALARLSGVYTGFFKRII